MLGRHAHPSLDAIPIRQAMNDRRHLDGLGSRSEDQKNASQIKIPAWMDPMRS